MAWKRNDALSFYLLLDKDCVWLIKMFGMRPKSKPKKRGKGFFSGTSGSVNTVDKRVVMLCEDIPSEGSSSDSSRGSNRREPLGKEGHSMSSSRGPTRQYSIQEIHCLRLCPISGKNSTHSTLCIIDQYESVLTKYCNLHYKDDWRIVEFLNLVHVCEPEMHICMMEVETWTSVFSYCRGVAGVFLHLWALNSL